MLTCSYHLAESTQEAPCSAKVQRNPFKERPLSTYAPFPLSSFSCSSVSALSFLLFPWGRQDFCCLPLLFCPPSVSVSFYLFSLFYPLFFSNKSSPLSSVFLAIWTSALVTLTCHGINKGSTLSFIVTIILPGRRNEFLF